MTGSFGIETDLGQDRRAFLSSASGSIVAATAMAANWPLTAIAASMAPGAAWTSLNRVNAGPLSVQYAELGPRDGRPVILLHGWPYDIHSFAEAAPKLAAQGYRVIAPYLRGFGGTVFRSASTARNAQQAALATDVIALMDTLQITKAVIAGFDWGARSANIVAALYPERCRALVSVSGYLIGSQSAGHAPLSPEAERSWWYQFYFSTERGRLGYERDRFAFNRLIWRLASPQWSFTDAVYERSAASFCNPDHVDIVVHNYRWRLGLADGERAFDGLERQLALSPTISTPTVTLEGDANDAPHPQPASYAAKFVGPYAHRLIAGGVGHNLPQEAPQAFANAILAADNMARAT